MLLYKTIILLMLINFSAARSSFFFTDKAASNIVKKHKLKGRKGVIQLNGIIFIGENNWSAIINNSRFSSNNNVIYDSKKIICTIKKVTGEYVILKITIGTNEFEKVIKKSQSINISDLKELIRDWFSYKIQSDWELV